MTATLQIFEHSEFRGRVQLTTLFGTTRYRHLSINDLSRTGLNDRLSSLRLSTPDVAGGYVAVLAEHPTGNLHAEYPFQNRFEAFSVSAPGEINVGALSSRINDRTSDVLVIRRSRIEVATHLDNGRIKSDVIEPAVRILTTRIEHDRLDEIRVGNVATRVVARPTLAPGEVLLGINMDLAVQIRRIVRRPVDADLELLFAVGTNRTGSLSMVMRGFRFDADARRRVRHQVEEAITNLLSNPLVAFGISARIQQELGSGLTGLKSAYVLPGDANELRDSSPYVGNQATSGTSLVFVCNDV